MAILGDKSSTVKRLIGEASMFRPYFARPILRWKWLALGSILALLPAYTTAQRVVGTVPVGSRSIATAINPVTNKIYIANEFSNSVTVVDGVTHASTTVGVGVSPLSVAVNPLTNRIYVADSTGADQFGRINLGGITMIDANNNNATIYRSDPGNSGGQPQAVVVDPITNLVFAVNVFGASVSVFDGNLVYKTTVVLGSTVGGQSPVFGPDIAIDVARSKLYVTGLIGSFGEGVTVLNEKDLSNPNPPAVGIGTPSQVVTDEVTNKIFALGFIMSSQGGIPEVRVIDGSTCASPPATCSSTSIHLGATGLSLALNPATHKVYVGNGGGVTVIDGSQAGNPTTFVALPANTTAAALAADALSNRIYVSSPGGNPGTGSVFVIDGTSDTLIGGSFSNDASAVLAVNPITNRIYTTAVTNTSNDNLVVIDGATDSLASISDQNSAGPNAIAVNPVTHKVYVANTGFDSRTTTGNSTISIIDPTQNNQVKTAIFDGTNSQPSSVAVNPATNMVYVANNSSNNVLVVDGNTDSTVTTITDPKALGPIAVIANPVNDKIYVANNASGNVTIIDGTSKKIINTIPAGPAPFALAVNNFSSHLFPGQVRHKIYVVNNVGTGGTVTEIDGDSDTVTNTISAGGFPFAIAVNPQTNQVWVANDGTNDITMFDAESYQTLLIHDPAASHPRSVDVNPASGKTYVANQGSNNVTIITQTFGFPFTTVAVGTNPTAVAVNPNNNHVYVANFGSDNLSVIDGATDSVATFKDGFAFGPVALAVDPTFNQAYAANSDADDQGAVGSDTLTAINEQQVQLDELQTSITPFPNDVTTSLTPTFDFATNSSFTPLSTKIDNLFFQIDSWEGIWQPASLTGVNAFTAMPSLHPGLHILYGFATDSREFTAGVTQNSLTTFGGNIKAYPFVAGAVSSLAVALTGPGKVTSNPAGINCPGTCSASFAIGTTVTLTPTPNAGAIFVGWAGPCTGTGNCHLTLNSNEQVTATFNQLFVLNVSKSGTGNGTVVSSPSGINCGTSCSASFPGGSLVHLTATAAAGSLFTGWGGACTGTGVCSVTMTAAESVSATFKATFKLTVTKTGTGTVTSNPAGINCGATCTATYSSGSIVKLTATPGIGWMFAGWGGACTGTGVCSVTMTAAESVSATFKATFKLTVTKTGTGTVTSNPAGINCGATCTATYSSGSIVKLTATPGIGWMFAGWGGACTGTGVCSVTMTAAKSVSATFKATFKLTVTKTGTGTVTSNPAGINCGATCTATYSSGSIVKLTATPGIGSTFAGWGGACTGTGVCSVTMTAAKSVSATFR